MPFNMNLREVPDEEPVKQGISVEQNNENLDRILEKNEMRDLTEAFESEISSDISEFAPAEFSIESLDKKDSLDEFIQQKIQENKDSKIAFSPVEAALGLTKKIEDHVFTEDTGYLYHTASNFYAELIKRARRFNKCYCAANSLILSAKRVLRDKSKGQKYSKDFNPFLYTYFIRHRDAPDDTKRVLCQHVETADEAQLKVAYSLGFVDSYEYKSLSDIFHGPTIAKILEDPKYLSVIRKTQRFIEESKQITQATYISPIKRESWLIEIQMRIQNDIDKIKGAI